MYNEARLCWPPLVSFKAAQLVQVANLWTPLGSMKIDLCTYHQCKCTFQIAEASGRVGNQVHNAVSDLSTVISCR